MKRITQLDGVRGLAILAVFVHHSLHAKLLWAGVDLFFILSGFLITGVLLDAKSRPLGHYFRSFYARRARRILVPYGLVLFLFSLCLGFAWLRHWYFYLGLMNFMMPLGVPEPDAFGPFWSLAVEEQFYLVWPFAVYFLSERGLFRLAAGLVVLAPVLRGVCHIQTNWAVYMLTPFRMDLLAAGAVLCLAYRHQRPRIERYGMALAGVLMLSGTVGLLLLSRLGFTTYANTRTGNVLIYECTLLAGCGIILWALSGRLAAPLRWTPLRYVGKVSYSMYLVHMGVILLAARIGSLQVAAAVSFAATLAYATASWYLVERPLLAAGHKAG